MVEYVTDKQKFELKLIFIATFLLRTGFGGAIILFDWTLVWGIEHSLGINQTSSTEAILIISTASLTYYFAEITLTGYYGNKSDQIGPRPVILYSVIGATVLLLFYMPASLFYSWTNNLIVALILLTIYLSSVHFVHGVFASANVAPSLGFVNEFSTNENRTLHMSLYDNAILYGRAAGIIIGGFLWILMRVDESKDPAVQAVRISYTYPFLSLIVLIAVLLVYFGIEDIPHGKPKEKFSIKNDIKIAAKVMLDPSRRHLLLPWVSIAALIGSASLWGPTVSYIISPSGSEQRGFDALLPIMIILIGLALPAPLWGMYADRNGKKKTLIIGLFGLPIAGILGLGIGFPFYRNDLSIHNIYLLLSLLPAAFMFSSMIPVLMGALGDTAEDKHHSKTMAGYHFTIATGEVVGILGGGIVIGFFRFLQRITGWFGDGNTGTGIAILIGFILFEATLVAGMIIGILKLPEQNN